jgi:hypothetical protein
MYMEDSGMAAIALNPREFYVRLGEDWEMVELLGTKVERGFLGLIGVGDEPGHEVDQEIGRATVAGVLDLGDVLELIVDALDVIVATHKTIDLVLQTQVYTLKRDMTKSHRASASSLSSLEKDVRELSDETPAHSSSTDCGGPATVGAPAQGA